MKAIEFCHLFSNHYNWLYVFDYSFSEGLSNPIEWNVAALRGQGLAVFT